MIENKVAVCESGSFSKFDATVIIIGMN